MKRVLIILVVAIVVASCGGASPVGPSDSGDNHAGDAKAAPAVGVAFWIDKLVVTVDGTVVPQLPYNSGLPQLRLAPGHHVMQITIPPYPMSYVGYLKYAGGGIVSLVGGQVGNTGGVRPGSLKVTDSDTGLDDPAVTRCGVKVSYLSDPSDTGHITVGFDVVLADYNAVCATPDVPIP